MTAKITLLGAAEFLKEKGYASIELLKYHNMYEDKAKRLNLDIPMLNITAEESLAALKKAIEVFKANGIDAYNDDIREAVKKAEIYRQGKAHTKRHQGSGQSFYALRYPTSKPTTTKGQTASDKPVAKKYGPRLIG